VVQKGVRVEQDDGLAAGPEGVADHVLHAHRLAVEADDVAVAGDGALHIRGHAPRLLICK
jgi:hypothetical protein